MGPWLFAILCFVYFHFLKGWKSLTFWVAASPAPWHPLESRTESRIEPRTLSPHLLLEVRVGHESSPRAASQELLLSCMWSCQCTSLCSLDPCGPKDRAGTCGAFLPRSAALALSQCGGRSRAWLRGLATCKLRPGCTICNSVTLCKFPIV